jgi:hypothetical protein
VARRVLDERERRRRNSGERNKGHTAPRPDTAHARLGPPHGHKLVRRPEPLERKLHRVGRVAPGGDVVSDRVVEVVSQLGT